MAMDYFRRPVLAGHNLARTTNAVVRGSVRRSDPDGSSAEPYFPDLNIGDTLTVDIDDGGSVAVVFTGVELQTVLDDINAGLTGCTAFDADGCVAIVTDTIGSLGSVNVVSGTGAAALGFDVISGSVFSYGGEIASTPEGRIGNHFGVAFPNRGENFTTEALNRAAARLSANTDVLFSELARERVVLQKVGSTTNGAAEGRFQAVTAPMFTGLGFLTRASTRTALSPFFFLYDAVTGLPAASRVTAVVKGTPGSYPTPGGGYADTASWGANDGGNVLGMNLVKVSAQAIDEIHEGRVVVVPTANFTTSNVRAGDLADITGNTNVSPFSHGGFQWVVESVLSATALSLRPMSKTEIVLTGNTAQDSVQPLVELNDEKAGGEVFGNLTIRTGTFMHGLTLVLEPPVPPNATYEIWAASPTNFRDAGVTQGRQALDELKNISSNSFLASDYDPVPTQIVSGFALSAAGVDLQVATGKVRWRGRIISIPTRVWANNGTVIPSGVSYLYFDEQEGLLKIAAATANWSSYFDETSANRGLLLAKLTAVTSTSVTIESAERFVGEKPKSLTVGAGGQFVTLKEAVSYANLWSSAKSETGTTATGAYAHWDIVLLNDQTISADIAITATGLTIRGANPKVTLTMNACKFTTSANTVSFKDLQLATSGVMTGVPFIAPSSPMTLRLENVRQTSGAFSHVMKSSIATTTNLTAIDCVFILARGVLWSDSGGTVILARSSFTYSSDGVLTVPVLFSNLAGTGDYINALQITQCTFSSWVTTSNTVPLFVSLTGSSASYIVACEMVMGSFGANLNAILIQSASRLYVEDTRITAITGISRVILGSTNTIVRNCDITCQPQAATAAGIYCYQAIENTVTVGAPSTLGNEGIGIKVSQLASGNLVSGQAKIGISTDTSSNGAVIANNTVFITYGVAAAATGIQLTNTNGSVTGNTVRMGTVTASTSKGIQSIATNQASIAGNSILGTVSYDIHVAAGTDVSITGNSGNGKLFVQPPVSAVFQVNSNSFNGALEVADGGVAGTVKVVGNSFRGLLTTGLTDVGLVHLANNAFTGTVRLLHLTAIDGNSFHDATVTYGAVTLLNNMFTGSTSVDNDDPGNGGQHIRADGNKFFNTGLVNFEALTFYFSNNEIQGPASFTVLSNYGDGGQLLVDGNYFSSLTASIQVTQFTNNYVGGGTLSLTGAFSFFGSAFVQAAATGNFFRGVLLSASKCAFGGSSFDGMGACSFNTCSFAGGNFDFGGAVTFTSCSIGGCRIHSDSANINLVTCELSGSYVRAVASSILFTGNSKTSSCELNADTNVSWAGSNSNEVTGSLIPGNMTASGSQSICISGCEVQGTAGFTTSGFVSISASKFLGAVTTNTAASVSIGASTFADTATLGAAAAAPVEVSGCRFVGVLSWSDTSFLSLSNSTCVANFSTTGTGILSISNCRFQANFVMPTGTSAGAASLTLTGCILDGDVTAYGNNYLIVTGCHFTATAASAADLTLKSGSRTVVEGCSFDSLSVKVILRGPTTVSGLFSGNTLARLRVEEPANGLIISGNTFAALSIGATGVIPLSVKKATVGSTFYSTLSITANSFISINGLVAGTTVQSPCVQLGDSGADTFEGTIFNDNYLFTTIRTSNSGATQIGQLYCVGTMLQMSIIGNHFVRWSNANSVTLDHIFIVAAGSTNIQFASNNAYANDSGVITYGVSTIAKGVLNHWAGGTITV